MDLKKKPKALKKLTGKWFTCNHCPFRRRSKDARDAHVMICLYKIFAELKEENATLPQEIVDLSQEVSNMKSQLKWQ